MKKTHASYRQNKEEVRNRVIVVTVAILFFGTLITVMIIQFSKSIHDSNTLAKTELMIEQNLESKNFAPLVSLLEDAVTKETLLSSNDLRDLAMKIIKNGDTKARVSLDSLFFETEISDNRSQAGKIRAIRTGMLFGYQSAQKAHTFSMMPLLRPNYGDSKDRFISEHPNLILQLSLLQSDSFTLQSLEDGLKHFLDSHDVIKRAQTSLTNFDKIKREFEIEVVRKKDLSYIEGSIFEHERFIRKEWAGIDLTDFEPSNPKGKEVYSFYKETLKALDLLERLEEKIGVFAISSIGTYLAKPRVATFVIRSEVLDQGGRQVYEAFNSDVGICVLITSETKFTSAGSARLRVREDEPMVLEDNSGFDKEYPVFIEFNRSHQVEYEEYKRAAEIVQSELIPIAEELEDQLKIVESIIQQ